MQVEQSMNSSIHVLQITFLMDLELETMYRSLILLEGYTEYVHILFSCLFQSYIRSWCTKESWWANWLFLHTFFFSRQHSQTFCYSLEALRFGPELKPLFWCQNSALSLYTCFNAKPVECGVNSGLLAQFNRCSRLFGTNPLLLPVLPNNNSAEVE